MEYLQTPDSAARIFALPTPGTASCGGAATGAADRPPDRQALRSSFQSLFSPDGAAASGPNSAALLPASAGAGSNYLSYRSQLQLLQRQQQQQPASTPLASNHHHHHHDQYTGLTPFLGAVTPALGAGAPALSAHFGGDGSNSSSIGGSEPPTPAVDTPAAAAGHSPNTTAALGQLASPYLQAAAKEAVRREFMNMPSYITGSAAGEAEAESPSARAASDHGGDRLTPCLSSKHKAVKAAAAAAAPASVPEQTVPGNDHAAKDTGSVAAAAAATTQRDGHNPPPAPQPIQPLGHQLHYQQQIPQVPMMHYPYMPYSGMMYMPYPGMQPLHGGMPPHIPPGVMMPLHKTDKDSGTAGDPQNTEDGLPPSLARPELAQHPQHQHMHGMFVMGPNGPMMIPRNYPMPHQMHQHMPMPHFSAPHSGPQPPTAAAAAGAAAAAAAAVVASAPAQPENATRRKERVEQEKQDLIREFKKKTREAALVRFRQKRRERRFGKLIRYDCRKKLADARPRIKGRFVRVKDGEEIEDDDSIGPDMEFEQDDVGSPVQVVPDFAIRDP